MQNESLPHFVSANNGSWATWITPKRLLLAAAVAVPLMCCIGGPIIGILGLGIFSNSVKNMAASMTLLSDEEEVRLKNAVSEGDALYQAGVKEAKNAELEGRAAAAGNANLDGAFQKYLVVVNAPFPLSDREIMARVYGRVIDLAIDRSNEALAKEVAIKAFRQDILPAVTSRKASPILSQARQAVKAQEREDMEWLEKHADTARTEEGAFNFDDGFGSPDDSLSVESSDPRESRTKGSAYIPSYYAKSAEADEAVESMRRNGTYTPEAERNIRAIYDAQERVKQRERGK